MILQCDDRQLRAGLARRRATKVSNYNEWLDRVVPPDVEPPKEPTPDLSRYR